MTYLSLPLGDLLKLSNGSREEQSVMFGESIEAQLNRIFKEEQGAQFIIIHDTDADGGCASGLMLSAIKHFQKKHIITEDDERLWQIDSLPLTSGSDFRKNALSSFRDTVVLTTEQPVFNCVVVVDHAFDFMIFKELYQQNDLVIWMDHHVFDLTVEEQAFDVKLGKAIIYINNRESATMKVYDCIDKFLDPDIKPFVSRCNHLSLLVDHHDSWRYGKAGPEMDRHAKHFNSWFRSLAYQYSAIHKLVEMYRGDHGDHTTAKLLGDSRLTGWLVIGGNIADARDMIADSVVEGKHHMVTWAIDNIDYHVAVMLHSDDMDNLADKMLAVPDVDLAAICYLSKRSKGLRVSLRSRGDVDVNQIARKFGGGGHKNAAGFEVPPDKAGTLFSNLTI